MATATDTADNLVSTQALQARAVLVADRLALPLVLALALVARLYLIVRAPGVLDGDEALVGIQAESIASGTAHPLPVFFPGQHYMGALEAYLAAGLFRLFGPSIPLLRLVPLAFALLLVALTYELARRVVGRQGAIVAALLAALSPLYVEVWSLKARGGYEETLALGVGLLAVTHRLLFGHGDRLGLSVVPARRPWYGVMLGRSYGWWLLWGLLAGLLFWINPVSVYYLVAGAAALIAVALYRRGWRRPDWADLRMAWPPVALIAAGIAIGGLPAWLDNIATGGATFTYLLGGSSSSDPLVGRVPRVAASFAADVLPKLTGAWAPWTGPYGRPVAVLGALVLALYALALLYVVVRLAAGRRGVLGYRARPIHGQGLLLFFGAVVVVVFCVSGFGALALNPYGFDAASRYALPLASVLPVAAGALIWRLWRAWLPLGAVALAVLLLANLYGYVAMRPNEIFQSEYWNRLPASEQQLAGFLARHDVHDVWMNHWAGYPLMFYANRQDPTNVAIFDYNDVVLNGGTDRLPWTRARVASDPHAAYVLVTNEADPPLQRDFQRLGARYAHAQVGPYQVYWPLGRPVPPRQVGDAIGFAY